MGSRLLRVAWVTGYSRVPEPPARTIPLYDCFKALVAILSTKLKKELSQFRNSNIASQSTVDKPRSLPLQPIRHARGTSELFSECRFRRSHGDANGSLVRSYARRSHSDGRDQDGP